VRNITGRHAWGTRQSNLVRTGSGLSSPRLRPPRAASGQHRVRNS
jgi:hypothetical protein